MNNQRSGFNFFSAIGFMGCGIILVVILLLCSCFGLMVMAGASGGNYKPDSFAETVEEGGHSTEKIAVINVEGVIMDADDGIHQSSLTKYILDSLDQANTDEDVKGIIIRLNTPGGSEYDSARITEKIYELQANDKVVVAVIDEIAASGGYYISAPADYIFTRPESWTGSIGVLIQTMEYEELLSKIGVKEVVVTNSKGVNKVAKDLDNPESEQHKIFKTMLDEAYGRFVTVIADGRGLSKEEVIKYADGRILSGQQAIDAKLVDKIGGYDDAIEYIKTEKDIESPKIVDYKRSELFAFNSISSKFNTLFKQTQSIHNTGVKVYAMPDFMFSGTESETNVGE